ncbi:hypothetical protein [Micromonospora auratinigra]|uniref:hypothetical protein n=1 Tax=Micromonospora auratinigra TaxID=261654 RepID=UPI001E57D20D|nr:hypothetical protein [Micromonospora auratinigra]
MAARLRASGAVTVVPPLLGVADAGPPFWPSVAETVGGSIGGLPRWTAWWDESDVAPMFPDPQTRRVVSAEQPRLPLSYYEQKVPVPDGWDDAACGYLLFGPPYEQAAQDARERGWDVDHVPGLHLHQLVDPDR